MRASGLKRSIVPFRKIEYGVMLGSYWGYMEILENGNCCNGLHKV